MPTKCQLCSYPAYSGSKKYHPVFELLRYLSFKFAFLEVAKHTTEVGRLLLHQRLSLRSDLAGVKLRHSHLKFNFKKLAKSSCIKNFFWQFVMTFFGYPR